MPHTGTNRLAWVSRHGSVAMLIAISSAILGLVGIPFILGNNLLRHDLVGHLASATFTKEYLFPSVSGYNFAYYCGAPQNVLYPPLLAYLSAALGQLIGVQLAMKCLVVAAVVATPYAIYWCARAHKLGQGPATITTLGVTAILAYQSEELGGNFMSTFEIGNLTNAIGLPLFLAYAASLAEWRRRPAAIALPTILLGLNLVTHLVGGIVAVLLLAGHGADILVGRRRAPAKRLVWALVHGLWALALASFFIVPLLAYQRFGSPDNHSYNQYPDSLLLLSVTALVLLCWYASGRRDRASVAPLAMLCGLLAWGRNFIFNDFFPRGLGLHVHRFKLYDELLLTLIAVWLVDGWVANWTRMKRELLGYGTAIAGLLALVSGLRGVDTRGAADQFVPNIPRLSSRVMVMSSPQRQTSDHAVQQLFSMRTGNLVGKGLFIETAANARYVLDLELLLAADASQVRTWGVELDAPARLEPLRPEVLRLLSLFGFGYVVANEPLHAGIGLLPMGEQGGGFTLYRANYAQLAEVWTGSIDSVRDDQFVAAKEQWFFGAHDRLVLGVAKQQVWSEKFDRKIVEAAKLLGVHVDEAHQQVRLDVAADAPVPILVKVTYAPQFRAFDASGHELPLFRVTPNFMLVVGSGQITIRYVATTLERVSRTISVVALVLLLGAASGMARDRRKIADVHG